MTTSRKHIPEGLHAVTPQLVVSNARALHAFCEAAFGAQLGGVMPGPEGKGVMHSFMRIGDSAIFASDAGFAKPTSANVFLYVEDADAAVARATAAGAKVTAPVKTMFWGDRWGMIEDPFGNVWQVATHVEDVSPEEMMRRAKAAAPGHA
jgi:uncharacterized glyoxalase superfamily protein PhnB